jgi:hypothetical protein
MLQQRGVNTKRPTVVFFLGPTNHSHHMIRQARIGDTLLVKSREMTGRTQKLPWRRGGEGVKKTENGAGSRRPSESLNREKLNPCPSFHLLFS